mgnify:FL=1
MRALSWDQLAWEDYLYWQNTDKLILKRINLLIKSILRDPFSGIGNPEGLKSNFRGYVSRRIDDEHRIVYKVFDDKIHIIQCRYHYTK